MNAPQLSVIIPTYNRGYCIAKAIHSALEQSLTDFEIVISDDGSTDDTADVVRALDSPRVRLVRKNNGGCSSARNFGIANVSTEYVAFLDSDDTWDRDWLRVALDIMQRDATIGAVYGSLELVRSSGATYGKMDLTGGGAHSIASVPYVIEHCAGLLGSNVVARRTVVESVGRWDESFKTSGDLDFGLRLAVATRVALVAGPMIKLVETQGSLSKNVNTGNRLRVLDKFESQHPDLARQHAALIRRSRARILRSYGEDLLWFGRTAEARAQLRASLRQRLSPGTLWMLLKASLPRPRRAAVSSH
jgi:glycosyltransferase involved in cell wall biosynthesis